MTSKKISAIKYQCDRCKTVVISECDAESVQQALASWSEFTVDEEKKNLCGKCSEEFREWIAELE